VIQTIEGGSTGMVRPDANGTEDLGVMQVNTIWIPALAARAGFSEAQTRQSLIEDPRFNIAAAALILRSYLAETHGALLPAIGDYHSHTPALNTAYVTLAGRTASHLFVGRNP
jgi:soluble lytic murein transglycosylase-like protein